MNDILFFLADISHSIVLVIELVFIGLDQFYRVKRELSLGWTTLALPSPSELDDIRTITNSSSSTGFLQLPIAKGTPRSLIYRQELITASSTTLLENSAIFVKICAHSKLSRYSDLLCRHTVFDERNGVKTIAGLLPLHVSHLLRMNFETDLEALRENTKKQDHLEHTQQNTEEEAILAAKGPSRKSKQQIQAEKKIMLKEKGKKKTKGDKPVHKKEKEKESRDERATFAKQLLTVDNEAEIRHREKVNLIFSEKKPKRAKKDKTQTRLSSDSMEEEEEDDDYYNDPESQHSDVDLSIESEADSIIFQDQMDLVPPIRTDRWIDQPTWSADDIASAKSKETPTELRKQAVLEVVPEKAIVGGYHQTKRSVLRLPWVYGNTLLNPVRQETMRLKLNNTTLLVPSVFNDVIARHMKYLRLYEQGLESDLSHTALTRRRLLVMTHNGSIITSSVSCELILGKTINVTKGKQTRQCVCYHANKSEGITLVVHPHPNVSLVFVVLVELEIPIAKGTDSILDGLPAKVTKEIALGWKIYTPFTEYSVPRTKDMKKTVNHDRDVYNGLLVGVPDLTIKPELAVEKRIQCASGNKKTELALNDTPGLTLSLKNLQSTFVYSPALTFPITNTAGPAEKTAIHPKRKKTAKTIKAKETIPRFSFPFSQLHPTPLLYHTRGPTSISSQPAGMVDLGDTTSITPSLTFQLMVPDSDYDNLPVYLRPPWPVKRAQPKPKIVEKPPPPPVEEKEEGVLIEFEMVEGSNRKESVTITEMDHPHPPVTLPSNVCGENTHSPPDVNLSHFFTISFQSFKTPTLTSIGFDTSIFPRHPVFSFRFFSLPTITTPPSDILPLQNSQIPIVLKGSGNACIENEVVASIEVDWARSLSYPTVSDVSQIGFFRILSQSESGIVNSSTLTDYLSNCFLPIDIIDGDTHLQFGTAYAPLSFFVPHTNPHASSTQQIHSISLQLEIFGPTPPLLDVPDDQMAGPEQHTAFQFAVTASQLSHIHPAIHEHRGILNMTISHIAGERTAPKTTLLDHLLTLSQTEAGGHSFFAWRELFFPTLKEVTPTPTDELLSHKMDRLTTEKRSKESIERKTEIEKKKQQDLEMLKLQTSSTARILTPSFGRPIFFELTCRNTKTVQSEFEISVDELDEHFKAKGLSDQNALKCLYLLSQEEGNYFRRVLNRQSSDHNLHRSHFTQKELESLLPFASATMTHTITLNPKQTLNVPFLFVSFDAGTADTDYLSVLNDTRPLSYSSIPQQPKQARVMMDVNDVRNNPKSGYYFAVPGQQPEASGDPTFVRGSSAHQSPTPFSPNRVSVTPGQKTHLLATSAVTNQATTAKLIHRRNQIPRARSHPKSVPQQHLPVREPSALPIFPKTNPDEIVRICGTEGCRNDRLSTLVPAILRIVISDKDTKEKTGLHLCVVCPASPIVDRSFTAYYSETNEIVLSLLSSHDLSTNQYTSSMTPSRLDLQQSDAFFVKNVKIQSGLVGGSEGSMKTSVTDSGLQTITIPTSQSSDSVLLALYNDDDCASLFEVWEVNLVNLPLMTIEGHTAVPCTRSEHFMFEEDPAPTAPSISIPPLAPLLATAKPPTKQTLSFTLTSLCPAPFRTVLAILDKTNSSVSRMWSVLSTTQLDSNPRHLTLLIPLHLSPILTLSIQPDPEEIGETQQLIHYRASTDRTDLVLFRQQMFSLENDQHLLFDWLVLPSYYPRREHASVFLLQQALDEAPHILAYSLDIEYTDDPTVSRCLVLA
ncbi:hypothetical protein BLNAU_8313 [Blattamonas nauphoetae]|uniref:Uncharacterized protein n=1 Tax=Blattamonas nauphoetae TaxID=2049346 RepID=A0ABQ9XYZ8_9EUKA|nr:hypothetical protein BLNAU_8313 [Blattamonas nauphoetae]